MINTCPNTSHPDFKKLEKELGKRGAYKAYLEYGETIPPYELYMSSKIDPSKITSKQNMSKEEIISELITIKDTYFNEEGQVDTANNIMSKIIKNGNIYDIDPQLIEDAKFIQKNLLKNKTLRITYASNFMDSKYLPDSFKQEISEKNKTLLGVYVPDENLVSMFGSAARLGGYAGFIETFIHEMIHAYTAQPFNMLGYDRSAVEREFVEGITIMYRIALDKTDQETLYGFTNPKEFISEIIANEEFRNHIKSLGTYKGDSIYDRIIEYILKFFGITSDDSIYETSRAIITKYIETIDVVAGSTGFEPLDWSKVEASLVTDEKLAERISNQINRLRERIKELNALKGSDPIKRQTLNLSIDTIRGSIQKLLNNISYSSLLSIHEVKLRDIAQMLGKSNIDGADLETAKAYIEDIQITLGELQAVNKDLTEEERARRNKIADELINMENLWKDKQITAILNYVNKEGLPFTLEDFNKAYPDLNWFSRELLSTEESTIPQLVIFSDLVESVKNKVREQSQAKEKEANKLRSKYNLTQVLASFFDSNGIFITEFLPSYYDKEREMMKRTQEDLKKYKGSKPRQAAIYQIRNKWFASNNDYTLTPESEKAYKDAYENRKLSLTDENGQVDDYSLFVWEAENSPYFVLDPTTNKISSQFANTGATPLNNGVYNKFWYKFLSVNPKRSLYENPAYKKIKDHEVYKFIEDTIIDAESRIPHKMTMDLSSYDRVLNKLTLDLNKATPFEATALLSNMKSTFQDWFTIDVTEEDLKGTNTKVKDVFGNDKNFIRATQLEAFKKGSYKDLFEMIIAFDKMSLFYKYKTEAYPLIELLKDSLKNAEAIKTNRIGVGEVEEVEGQPDIPLTIKGGLENAQKQLEFAANAFLFDKTRTDKEKINAETTGKKFSFVKAGDFIVDYTRVSTLGLKPFSAIANLVIGMSSNFQWAARKRDFDDKALLKASGIIISSMGDFWLGKLNKVATGNDKINYQARKVYNILRKFGILEEGLLEKDDIGSKFKKLMYSLQQGGEFLIHGQGTIAKMMYTEVLNKKGEKKNLWDAFDDLGNWKTNEFGENREWESVEVLNEQGINVSKQKQFIKEIKDYRKATQGDYMNALLAKSKLGGRILLLFRTWLPQAIEQRFGSYSEYKNFKGRYLSYRDIANQFEGNWLTRWAKLGGITAAKILDPLTGYSLGIDKKLEEKGISTLDIENMRVNVRELQMMLGFTILLLMLAGLDDGDDDMNLAFLINLGQRTYQDLSFFYNPRSAQSILRDIIPITKTINDAFDVVDSAWVYITDHNKDTYTRGFRKGGSKLLKETTEFFPVGQAIQNTISVLNSKFNSQSYKNK